MNIIEQNIQCPLCGAGEVKIFYREESREFWKCLLCQLIFVPPRFHLRPHEERARYEQHENDPSDPRYRKFLRRLLEFLEPKLKTPSRGLDFGSGPGPAISVMMVEKGHYVENYDPYFCRSEEALGEVYDFVTCTETVEHFFRPRREFVLLNRLLRNRGWLGVMTELVREEDEFAQWYYRRDPTHVCFYRRETMQWIARWLCWKVEFPRRGVVLFQKSPGE